MTKIRVEVFYSDTGKGWFDPSQIERVSIQSKPTYCDVWFSVSNCGSSFNVLRVYEVSHQISAKIVTMVMTKIRVEVFYPHVDICWDWFEVFYPASAKDDCFKILRWPASVPNGGSSFDVARVYEVLTAVMLHLPFFFVSVPMRPEL